MTDYLVQASMSWGRDQYFNFPEDWLSGCVNDAKNMRKFFIDRLGLREDNSSLLLNTDCTKPFMLHALGMLTEAGSKLQRAFLTDSGHGTTSPDSGEPDGLEGALCCYTLKELPDGEYNPATLFLESDFREALARVPASCLLECWEDACYVGEFADLPSAAGYRVGPGCRVRSLPPRRRIVHPVFHRVLRDRAGENTVVWAACGPTQTSAEGYFAGQAQGAFTYYFIREYEPDMPRQVLLEKVTRALEINGYSQRPMLSCSDRLKALPVGEM